MRHRLGSPRRRVSRMFVAFLSVCSVIFSLIVAPSASASSNGIQMPLRTSGNKIVDANGDQVTLQGVNWFGFETNSRVAHGLWQRDYKDMLAHIKSLGFNTIRLPFSLAAIDTNVALTHHIWIDKNKNWAMKGKTPLERMDLIIDEAERLGLLILLDNHSQQDDDINFPQWYGNGYTEDQWINRWEMLAERYANKTNIIGADLKTEPHGDTQWGTGNAKDWRRAAERAGNAILAKNSDWLIVVEGIDGPIRGGNQLPGHWWGGNLEGVRNYPVNLNVANRVVYSPHEYGPGVDPADWFNGTYEEVSARLLDRWQKGFAYIHDQEIAPILVGEFGGFEVGTDTVEGRWQRQFANYLSAKGMSWTYWSWNPNSSDTGGVLLTNDDWSIINQPKMALLRSLMNRETIAYAPGSWTPSPTPTPPIKSPVARKQRPSLTTKLLRKPTRTHVGRIRVIARSALAQSPKGKVQVRLTRGRSVKKVGRSLSSGKAVIRLPKLSRGKWRLSVRYFGDVRHSAVTRSVRTIRSK